MNQINQLTATHERGQKQLQKDLESLKTKIDQMEIEETKRDSDAKDMKKDITELQDGLTVAAKCIEAVEGTVSGIMREIHEKHQRQLKDQVVRYNKEIAENGFWTATQDRCPKWRRLPSRASDVTQL